ncbi:hypothetical protein G7Y89_g11224 [Cudoniella acicularis]|uniref:Uncharacterized protein n=1 Tax=Cudoniella acicularis TaxID=354080 RepID=A0A8H4RCC2_9HELO|nr:hypothetical protein G7Y89_g11224 [Cudoniella acicularis]
MNSFKDIALKNISGEYIGSHILDALITDGSYTLATRAPNPLSSIRVDFPLSHAEPPLRAPTPRRGSSTFETPQQNREALCLAGKTHCGYVDIEARRISRTSGADLTLASSMTRSWNNHLLPDSSMATLFPRKTGIDDPLDDLAAEGADVGCAGAHLLAFGEEDCGFCVPFVLVVDTKV